MQFLDIILKPQINTFMEKQKQNLIHILTNTNNFNKVPLT